MGLFYDPTYGQPGRPKWLVLVSYRLHVNCISCMWRGRRTLKVAEPALAYGFVLDREETIRIINTEQQLHTCPKCNSRVIANKVGAEF